jgi:beta-galactosidase GanA
MPRVSPETGETLLYVLNHNATPTTVTLPSGAMFTDLLTGREHAGNADLEGYGVHILAPA